MNSGFDPNQLRQLSVEQLVSLIVQQQQIIEQLHQEMEKQNAATQAVEEYRQEAEKMRQRADSNLLVAYSSQEFTRNPTLSYRLAELAYRVDPTNVEALKNLLHTYYDSHSFYIIIAKENKPKFGTSDSTHSISFSSDGKSLLTANLFTDNVLRQYDFTGKEIRAIVLSQPAHWATFSPNSQYIITTSRNSSSANLWDINGQKIRQFCEQFEVKSVGFSSDGNYVITTSGHGACLWHLSGEKIREFRGHINTAVISPDGRYLLTAGGCTARLWSLDGEEIQRFEHKDSVTAAVFSPNGKTIVTTSWDRTARLWWLSGQEVKTYKGHESRVFSPAFSPDGEYLATASWDGTVRIWYGTTNGVDSAIKVLNGHSDGVNSVKFSPDGKHIASTSSDNTLRLWDVKTPKILEIKICSKFPSPSASEHFRLEGDYWGVTLLDIKGNKLFVFKVPFRDRINSGIFSPDNNYIYVNGYSYPFAAEEIMRLVNDEKRFGNIWKMDEQAINKYGLGFYLPC
jgi:WD40 repeat protein